jgi:putative transposase
MVSGEGAVMTTLDVVPKKKPEPSAEETAAKELVRLAREQGLSLTGPDGLLKQFTKSVLETALNEEMTEHLGHEKHRAAEERDSTNVRNGSRPKTVLTEATGQVQIEVPRDRDGSFEPVIVKKRQRRLTGVDEIVLSLYAKGLTTGEISAHFAEIYGASVSKETVSRITDKVVEEMTDWANRPLQGVYAAVFIDAIMVKVRDGQVANRPIYAAIGVSLAGEKDVLGLWAGTGGEGAKFWMAESGRGRRVLLGLRRLERAAGGGGERVAVDHSANLHRPPDPQHVPARLAEGLGRAETRCRPDLHRGERLSCPVGVG